MNKENKYKNAIILDNIVQSNDLDNIRSEMSDDKPLRFAGVTPSGKNLTDKQHEEFLNIVLDEDDLDWNRAQRKKRTSKPKPKRKPVKKCKCK